MGHVYKRGNVWWLKYSLNGKTIRESSGSPRKAVADRLLKINMGEIAQGKLPSSMFEKVTFAELAEDLLTDYQLNGKKSADRVEQCIRLHLRPFFGNMRAPEITSSKIREYTVSRVSTGAKNATVNRELAYLKRMLNLGAQQIPPKVDRVPKFQMLKENNVRKGFFEKEQFEKLLLALPEYLQGLVEFAYRTGWRKGEILNLTWDRVDRKNSVVRLETGETKSGQARTLYLDDELKRVIQRQHRSRQLGCQYVFHRNGSRIKDFRWSWEKACEAAGVPGRLFHDLRRTAVRNMIRAGVPERVAMMISGHKTREVFDRYNIVSEEDLKMAAELYEAYLK